MNYEFTYIAPSRSEELVELLSNNSNTKMILAGGTDLIPSIRLGAFKPDTVIDIKKIPEHRIIKYDEKDGLSIGAAVTVNELIENRIAQSKYRALVLAGKELASNQIRNRATVIGNICNASPCADMALPLLCLGAKVILVSARGRREMVLQDFFAGVKKTQLGLDEYCERITVPSEYSNSSAGFKKLKRIKGHDLALVSVCATQNQNLIRIAVGSSAPTPVFAGEFDKKVTHEKIIREVLKKVNPIDDIRASREYRLFMLEAYLKRLLKEISR